MNDVTVKRIDELDGHQGIFLYAGKGLGVTAWGMNLLNLPGGWADYPNHDHAEDGQEEAYIVLSGSAVMEIGEDRLDLAPGMMVRVGPETKRKIVPGEEGVRILAIGGTPGKAFGSSE